MKIVRASSTRLEEFTGFDDAGGPVNFVVEAKGKSKEAKAAAKKFREEKKKREEAERKGRKDDKDGRDGKDSDDPKRPWESVVVVGRTGEISLPAEVVLTFANGKTWRTTWDGVDTWVRYQTVYPSRLVRAEVDPGRNVVLDRNPWNNARVLKGWKGSSAAAKVRAYAVHALQVLSTTLWALL
ncbi:MAG: hypothetical protein WCP53_09110 [Verrucomicrobiota bacterium]